MEYTETIENLQKIISDPNCDRMNKSVVIGYLGEILVKEQLEKLGLKVEHCGNQRGHDLIVRPKDKVILIDVKTSRIKDEYNLGIENWGWALIHENKKKEITATHFICVGLDEKLKPDSFVLIPASDAVRFPHGIKQFSKVNNSICLLREFKLPREIGISEIEYIWDCKNLIESSPIVVRRHGNFFSIEDFK